MSSITKLQIIEHIHVPEETCRAWRECIDPIAGVFNAPVVLLTRFHNHNMEVLIGSGDDGNPAGIDQKDLITLEKCCEHVLIQGKPLYIPSLPKDPYWGNNTGVSTDILSYLGMPIFWPRGEAFGAISVLDTEETAYPERSVDLLERFTAFFMSDLRGLYLEAELEKANKAARKLKKEMSLFLGIAAHDLKSSLSVLMGCSSMLMEKVNVQTKKERTYLDLIQKSGIAMQNLLEELMEISRIESMRVPMSVQEVDLIQVVKDSVQGHQPLAEAKGIQINLLAQPDPLVFSIDSSKIDQVLSNLISNALKFSQRYSVITVSVDRRTDEAVISVQDQGPGIPMEEQYNLFRPFQTTSVQAPEGETSTGLGLYIARRIVEEHGGRIWVESEAGSGSMFCFSLRQVQAPADMHEKNRQPAHARNRTVPIIPHRGKAHP